MRSLLLAILAVAGICVDAQAEDWSNEELAVLRSLWIGSLPPLPTDPSNPVADDPRAAELGHRLFFDARLSANGAIACVSCHVPDLAFTDGRQTAVGLGLTIRNAPTLVGIAYSPWYFWDGRKDSLWSQALAPLESPVEHGTDRIWVVELMRRDADYRARYEALFGPLPGRDDTDGLNHAFANVGRALAAYQRRLVPGPSRFDRYVEALLKGRAPEPENGLNQEEQLGLRVFISDNLGQCVRCHNGPLFTDNHFHNIGSDLPGRAAEEQGRLVGIRLATADPFNCLGPFSGAPPTACDELRFAKLDTPDLAGAFKTPTLRNLAKTAPYMHAGRRINLEAAIWHYREPPPAMVGQSELSRLTLTGAEFEQVTEFLLTLESPIAAPERFLRPPH